MTVLATTPACTRTHSPMSKDWLAVTIPNWPTFIHRFGAVFLCPVFWEVSTTGTDSQVSLSFSESSKVYREIYGLHSRVEHWFMSLLTLPLTLELRTMSMVNPAANNSPTRTPLKLSIMPIHMNISQRTTQPCHRCYWPTSVFMYYQSGTLYDKKIGTARQEPEERWDVLFKYGKTMNERGEHERLCV
jgi:hypothetical protein